MTRRYEKEIMELLERKERENRGRERVERVRRNVHSARKRVAPNVAWQKLGGLRWTVSALALALFAFVLHMTIPAVTNVLIIVAVGLFLVPVFFRPAHTLREDNDPLWRGQRIEPLPFPDRRGPFSRLRRLLEEMRRGGRDR